MAILALADRQTLGVAAPHVDDRLRHERVVDDRIGLHQHALGTQGQQVLGARAGADQPDMPLGTPRRRKQRIGRPAGSGRVVCIDRVGDIAREETAPEDAARDAARHAPFGGIPVFGRKPRQPAERRRQHLVDAGADHLGENGTRPFRTDRDGDGGAVDDSRRVEIAEFRLVDGISRNLLRPGGRHDFPVPRGIAGRGENQRGTPDLRGRKFRADDLDALRGEICGVILFRRRRIGDDAGIGIAEQPDLGKGLVAIAEYENAPSAHAEEGRKDRQTLCILGHAGILNHIRALSAIAG